jgi:molybdopterin-binding protein
MGPGFALRHFVPHCVWSTRHEQEGTMKLSARNRIKGRIIDVKMGATTAHVKIDIGGGQVITSAITNEAVDELDLTVGREAYAVIKASDVMIGMD